MSNQFQTRNLLSYHLLFLVSSTVNDPVVPELPSSNIPVGSSPVVPATVSSEQSQNVEEGSEKALLSESGQGKAMSSDPVPSVERRYPSCQSPKPTELLERL